MVHFPTRIQNNSISAIDNIFIDLCRAGNYTIGPLVNGPSDHDAQIVYINDINLEPQNNYFQSVRKFNKNTMNEFMIKLS
jgi:hypothetical protein